MSEEDPSPDWLNVLVALYEHQIATIDLPIDGSLAIDPENPAYSDTDLDASEISEAMTFLRKTGLITVPPQSDNYVITEEGFNVVHDWKTRRLQAKAEDRRSKNQNDVNRVIGILTLGLVAISAINAVSSSLGNISETGQLFSISYQTWSIIAALLSIFVAIGLAYGVLQSGLLEDYQS